MVAWLALMCLATGCWAEADRTVMQRGLRGLISFPLLAGRRVGGHGLGSWGRRRSSAFVALISGTCTPSGTDEPSCTPPLQLQFSHVPHPDVMPRLRSGSGPASLGAGQDDRQRTCLFPRRVRSRSTAVRLRIRSSLAGSSALRSANDVAPVMGPTTPSGPRPRRIRGRAPARRRAFDPSKAGTLAEGRWREACQASDIPAAGKTSSDVRGAD